VDSLEGKVAVVTGAASGIGLGMTEAFAHRGMKVVMADVEDAVLSPEADRLQKANYDVTPCKTDVRFFADVENLLQTAIDAYGKVHLLCNNAGVSGAMGGGIWSTTQKDWDWVLGVNLQGVVNGLRAFVPHMLEHKEPAHIVNTSSIMGLTTGGGSIYSVSKHAVARLSEGLFHDLKAEQADIGVTLLCPGMIATNILTSGRNRPDEFQTESSVNETKSEMIQRMDTVFKTQGMPPRQAGELVADAVLNKQFYLLTHPDNMAGVQRRFDDIVNLSDPAPPTWGMPD
jgi:NAD(P)-dependent dehydrogenase (short-subunit alcohol dehydrogenase family)